MYWYSFKRGVLQRGVLRVKSNHFVKARNQKDAARRTDFPARSFCRVNFPLEYAGKVVYTPKHLAKLKIKNGEWEKNSTRIWYGGGKSEVL